MVIATGAVAASALTSLPPGSAGSSPGPVAEASVAPAASASAPPTSPTPTSTPGTGSGAAARAPRVFFNGSRAKRDIALTFDDGWSSKNGRLIYQILVHEHIPATFFLNSVWLARDPDLWKAISLHPEFVVGNHTYLHDDVTKMTSEAMTLDLQRNARTWEAVTGKPMAPLFRPPYGFHNAATDRTAAAAGFPDIILWDALANDTTPLSDAQLLRNATAGRAGSIVLMHIGPDATPRILERVIASYRSRGFTFVNVPQLLPPYKPPTKPGSGAGSPSPTPTAPVVPDPVAAAIAHLAMRRPA